MCNAHNHPPGCSCGWGKDASFKDEESTFTSMFGRIGSKRKKKDKKEDLTCSKKTFNELFGEDDKNE